MQLIVLELVQCVAIRQSHSWDGRRTIESGSEKSDFTSLSVLWCSSFAFVTMGFYDAITVSIILELIQHAAI